MIGREQLERLWMSLLGLGGRRLSVLALVGVTVFGTVALSGYYLSRPDLETLYGGLNAQDVSRIGATLKEAGIAFDVNSQGNAVLVRRGQTAQARMLLAEKGLPSSTNAGYELFDKLGSIGLTSFMQEVTRVRALEGEIARTIQGMRGVKAARVHIVLPDSGSFRRNRQPPSASVIIRTDAANDFSSAPAIRHLVAAAVSGMTIDQVTVLSTDGTILASGGDSASASPAKMMSLEKTVGRELQDNIAKTLTPYLGFNNFEISVAARLNTDKRQTNETAFNPESRVERSVRVIKETGNQQNINSRTAVGVEQNVPAEQASTASGDQSKRSNERREELTNYEVELEDDLHRQRGLQDRPADRCRGDQPQAAAGLAGRGRRAGGRRQAAEGSGAPDRERGRHRRQARRPHYRLGGRVPAGRPAARAGRLARHRRSVARAIGQHRQCLGHRRRRRAADLVRAAAGDAGNPGGQGQRAGSRRAAAGAAAACRG